MFIKKEATYVYIEPENETTARWEHIDEQELERRIENGSLTEGCRLFKVEREIKVSFERVTHLD